MTTPAFPPPGRIPKQPRPGVPLFELLRGGVRIGKVFWYAPDTGEAHAYETPNRFAANFLKFNAAELTGRWCFGHAPREMTDEEIRAALAWRAPPRRAKTGGESEQPAAEAA